MADEVVTPRDGYLTTEDVAARFRTAASTVRYWRHIGTGPSGVKIGRRVLYPTAEVRRWEQEMQARERALAASASA